MAYAIFISLVMTWYLAYLNNLKSHNDVVVLQCFQLPSFLGYIFPLIYSSVISFFDLTGITKHPSGSAMVKCAHRKQSRSHQFSLFFFSFLFFSPLLAETLFATTEGWHDRAVKTQQDRYIFNKGSWSASPSLVTEPGKFMRKKLTHYSNSTI